MMQYNQLHGEKGQIKLASKKLKIEASYWGFTEALSIYMHSSMFPEKFYFVTVML